MNINKLTLIGLFIVSSFLMSNPAKADPKAWIKEWVAELASALKKGKAEPVFDLEAAAQIASRMLDEDRFKIWEINSGGNSCQADAVFIRDLMKSGAKRPQEALLALLLTHHRPENAGKRFEPENLADNLVTFGLLKNPRDMSRSKAITLLRATRLAYMRLMVFRFGHDPNVILEPEGSRFRIKEKDKNKDEVNHKVEFYKDVFRAFHRGPLVLALYQGFPVLEKGDAFAGVQYLFAFDFDAQKGRWVLRTQRKDTNMARYGHGPYITPNPDDPRAYIMTMNPDTPWISPPFVDEGVGPSEGENYIVTHVGGLWQPGTRDPAKSFVEEIGLTKLEIEDFLNESVIGWEVGPSSSVVQFSVLHHNFVQSSSKAFFKGIPGFERTPPIMQLHYEGSAIPIEGQDSYPCHIQATTPGACGFGYADRPDVTITVMIQKKAYILKIPSKSLGGSYFHDFASAEFTVVDSNKPDNHITGSYEDWKNFMKAISPYVNSNMAPRGIEEFAKVGVTKDNFSWWQDIFGQLLLARAANADNQDLKEVEFPNIEVKFVEKALGTFSLGLPKQNRLRRNIETEEDALIEATTQSLEAIEKVRLRDGRVVDATFSPRDPDGDCLFSSLGISRADFIAAVLAAWLDNTIDDVLRGWIIKAMAEEKTNDILTWEERFSSKGRWGGITHMRLLSRLFGVRIDSYVIDESAALFVPLVDDEQGVVDESHLAKPDVAHLLWRSLLPMGANGPVNHFDRIDLHEHGRDAMVPLKMKLHPPDSPYRGPCQVGDVLNLWIKPYEPGKGMIVSNQPQPKPCWHPPRRDPEHITKHEQACLKEVKRAFKEGVFDARWLATLPPFVIRLIFEQNLLNLGKMFDPTLDRYNELMKQSVQPWEIARNYKRGLDPERQLQPW